MKNKKQCIILDFVNIEGSHVDPETVEMKYDGEFNFYQTNCDGEVQEVFPVYQIIIEKA